MKVDITQFVASIIGALVSGILLFVIKDLISTIRNLKKEIEAFRIEHVTFRVSFDLFKERTDAIPGMKENINEAHKRITDIQKGQQQ